MYGIDDPTAVSVAPAVPAPAGTGEGFFTNGNINGQAPTNVPDWWLNQVQGELRSIVVAAGQATQKGTLQVLPALQSLFGDTSSLATHGYVKLSSGLIIQWGTNVTVTGFLDAFVFPIAFPNAILSIMATEANAAGWQSAAAPVPTIYGCNRVPVSLSNFQVCAVSIGRTGVPVANGGLTFSFIAIGW